LIVTLLLMFYREFGHCFFNLVQLLDEE